MIIHKMLLLSTVVLGAVGDGEYGIIWVIVGVLAIIALLMYVLGRRG